MLNCIVYLVKKEIWHVIKIRALMIEYSRQRLTSVGWCTWSYFILHFYVYFVHKYQFEWWVVALPLSYFVWCFVQHDLEFMTFSRFIINLEVTELEDFSPEILSHIITFLLSGAPSSTGCIPCRRARILLCSEWWGCCGNIFGAGVAYSHVSSWDEVGLSKS